MTFLNRRFYDNVTTFVDSLSGANRIAIDVTKPNGVLTLAISGNIVGDNIKVGLGTPEGSVSGKIGDVYQRQDGSAGTSLYIKESGLGNTGWTAVAPGTSGGASLSGGIPNRMAVWSSTSAVSASRLLAEGNEQLIISGTTVMTTAKGTGEIWTALRINDGMSGGVNASGDYPGSRILYESDPDAFNPYRGAIEFGVQDAGMDSKSRMTLFTQNAYYEPLVPGVTIIGGTPSDDQSCVLIKAMDRMDNRTETFQVSGYGYFTNTLTSKGGFAANLILGADSALDINSLDAAGTSTAQGRLHYYRSDYVASNFANTVTLNTGTTATRVIIATSSNPFTAIPNAVFSHNGRTLFGKFSDNGTDTVQVSGTMISSNLKRGSGTPEGAISGSIGDIYQRTNGSVGTSLYIKESGADTTTGWVAVSPSITGAIGGTFSTGHVIFGSATPSSVSGSNTMTYSLTGGFSVNRSSGSRTETFGLSAGNFTMTGADNTLIGWKSGGSHTSAARSTALGSNSLRSITTASDNTAVGYNALQFATGVQNTALGSGAGDSISSGTLNVAIGYNALMSATTVSNNTACGAGALEQATGTNNTGIGQDAGAGVSTGTGNTCLGATAGSAIGAGSDNTVIGYASNVGSTLGSNVVIGHAATVLGVGSNGCTIIGTDANVDSGSVIGLGREVTIPGSTPNVFVAGSSSYPINSVYFGKGISNATPTAYTIHGTTATGSNIPGGAIALAGGRGTGTGIGGSITFQTAPSSASASTTNILMDRLTIMGDGGLYYPGIFTSAQPTVSTSGAGKMYYDRTDNKFKYSEDGGSYADCFGGSLSGGVAGRVSIWSGTSDISASRFIREYSNSVVISGSSEFIISNTFTGTPPAPNVSLAIGDVGDGVVAINDPKFLRIGYNIDSNYGFVQASRPDFDFPDLKLQDQGGLTVVCNGLDVNNSVLKNHISELIVDNNTSITIPATAWAGNVVNISGGTVALEVPNDLPVGFTCLVIQGAAGTITVSAGSGATVVNRQSHTTLAGQYATASFVCIANAGGSSAVVVFSGDTAP